MCSTNVNTKQPRATNVWRLSRFNASQLPTFHSYSIFCLRTVIICRWPWATSSYCSRRLRRWYVRARTLMWCFIRGIALIRFCLVVPDDAACLDIEHLTDVLLRKILLNIFCTADVLSTAQVVHQLLDLRCDFIAETFFLLFRVATGGDQQELVQLLFKKSILGVMAGTEVQDFTFICSLQ